MNMRKEAAFVNELSPDRQIEKNECMYILNGKDWKKRSEVELPVPSFGGTIYRTPIKSDRIAQSVRVSANQLQGLHKLN